MKDWLNRALGDLDHIAEGSMSADGAVLYAKDRAADIRADMAAEASQWPIHPDVEQVRVFHITFGAHVQDQPWMPDLSLADRQLIRNYALSLAAIAHKIKRQAAECNGLGRVEVGLLLIRLQLAVEEVGELAEAWVAQDLVKVLDALTDIGYVNNGTYLTHGLQRLKVAADREVHQSNMSKLDADGRPIIDASGRVVKSDQYRPPDLRGLLECYIEQEVI